MNQDLLFQDRFLIDKRQMRQAFEQAAHTYDAVAVLQNEVNTRLLKRLELVVLKPQTILDVGCGTGRALKGLHKRFRNARIVALDIALSMLRQSRTQRTGLLRRPLLICGDAESLPLADSSVDLLFSNLTVQWCNQLEFTLAEFRRVLAPGGLAMFTTLGPDTLRELRASWSEVDTFNHVNAFIDMHLIGDALLRAGFADPVMDMEMMYLTYTDIFQLMRELKLIGARNNTLGRPQGLTGKGRLQKLAAAYEAFRTPAGTLPVSYEVIYGHAWALEKQQHSTHNGAGREVHIPLNQLKHQSSKPPLTS